MKDFEYKIGDKVRCKTFFKNYHNYYQFYSGSIYEIKEIYPIYDSEILEKKNTFGATTRITINSHTFDEKEFYKYFFSKKEIRELKLKKINKNGNS